MSAGFLPIKATVYLHTILAFADYNKPFRVHTDASGMDLGTVLYQAQENSLEGVIVYTSRTLSKRERNIWLTNCSFLH